MRFPNSDRAVLVSGRTSLLLTALIGLSATSLWAQAGVLPGVQAAPPTANDGALGELFAGDADVRGLVRLADNGMRIFSGSQITAADGVATLQLTRGGQLRVCPRTSLSLAASNPGHALSLGLSAGAVELDYELDAAADTLLTPDFRLQLVSPGRFHLAISVAPSGDTCLHALAGNDAAVFVTEMRSNESYQLAAGRSVLFRGGQLTQTAAAPSACGCPAAALPRRTSVAVAPPEASPASLPAIAVAAESAAKPAAAAASAPQAAFVFQGKAAEEDWDRSVSRLHRSPDRSALASELAPEVQPPVAPVRRPSFWQRFKHLFGG